MPGKNERAVALDVLGRILDEGAYNSIALSDSLERCHDKRARAFVTEITNGTLRNLALIDYIIAGFSSVPIVKIKPVIRNILRLSVYEIMFLSTPGYAVCSEAVHLAQARGFKGLSGFVNGILRNIIRQKDAISFPEEKEDPAEYLSLIYSHPKWIVEKWLSCYEYDFVKNILEKNNEPPEVTVRVNTLKTNKIALIKALAEEEVSARESELCENALLIKGAGSIKSLDSYKNGLFHVQDSASQIAVMALAPEKGDVIADLCAAPGGKSFLAAYFMENEGKVYSWDIHSHKTKLVADGAKRLGISIIETGTRDAAVADASMAGKADRVIIDAPCSGLGILRKSPDIRLNRKKEDISSLQGKQREILTSGASYVKKGGFLIYSTCTLTNEENIDNINWFTRNFPFEKADILPFIPSKLKNAVNDGCLTLFPHLFNTDGFFIAKLKKVD